MAERRQQVEELFHAALARNPRERSSFLSEACSSDPGLRAEVESLISAHEQPGSFLDSPAVERTADLIDGAQAYSLVGSSMGHYEVLDLIGRGGMGDVYLARDKLLDRKVALKLLPLQYTADEIRLRRFTQEAKAASSLNHPNIITIHQIGHDGSAHFIATEFVEGKTLRKYMKGRRMAVDETLDIAIQVASALAASHAAGIVHRDIKPDNIMIRPDGYVKVLDFGLAKLTERPTARGNTDAATVPNVDTDPGTVMGTTRYMSPEQARGLDVDARSDIFNLGIVLYEMLTGNLPFDGDTTADVIASILKSEPAPLADLVPDAPPELVRVVSTALSKETAARYQTSEEMLAELKAIKQQLELGHRSTARANEPSVPAGARGRARALSAWLAVGLLMAAVAIGVVLWRQHDSNSRAGRDQSTQESVHAVQITSWRNAPGESLTDPKFSPDGTLIAYSAIQGEHPEAIWVKQVTGGNPLQVTNDELGAFNPVWSPDGRQLAFVSQQGNRLSIGTIPHIGGSPVWLKALDEGRPVLKHWSRDGGRIFYELRGNLFALDLDSRRTERLTNFEATAVDPKEFSISPDENRIAYRVKKDGQFDIWVMTLPGGAPVQVTDDSAPDRNPFWLADGERIVYTSEREGTYQICVAFVDGRKPQQITLGEGRYEVSDVSADGSKILYTYFGDRSNIWSVRIDDDREIGVTSTLGVSVWPDVSPDGKMLAFQVTSKLNAIHGVAHSSIFLKPLGSTGQDIQIASDGYDVHWLPNGTKLSFLRMSTSDATTNIWTVGTSTGDEAQITTGGVSITGFIEMPYTRIQTGGHSWSPDGNQMAYCSNKSGRSEVWTVNAKGGNENNISNSTDSDLHFACPIWSPDSTRIAFLSLFRGADNANHKWTIWVAERDGPIRAVYSSGSYLRLLGWSDSGNDLFIALARSTSRIVATGMKVELLRVPVVGVSHKTIAKLESAYADNIRLSPNAEMIAFTSRQDGIDNIWMVPATGGEAQQITRNNDQGLYYSTMAWSPDAKTIYYGRQERWRLVSMIDNFK